MESKVFQIPISQFYKDMETSLAVEKKNEILDLFTNYNKLHSDKEFNHIKQELHKACRKGDLELIKIYLSEEIENETKDLKFKIDETNKTASLFKVNEKFDHIIIPRTVKHESTHYLITSITCIDGDAKTINFSEDSAVKTIYGYSFQNLPGLKEIYFPASLCELKEGWCSQIFRLKKIIVSPSNDNFKFKEDKYLVGKSDFNNTEYDVLLFARRDIKEIFIPPEIKIISSHAFAYCKNLIKIEIPTNSNLQIIGKDAFYKTQIEEIYFPEKLSELKDKWSRRADELKKIIVSPLNDNFKFKEDKYLVGKNDSNNTEYDVLLFACRDIKEIFIPSEIKIISSHAFSNYTNLIKVEIPTNSNLQIIGKDAFEYTWIKKIFIPSKVTKICEYTFLGCENLKKIEISLSSNLQTIEPFAFYISTIEEIFIPPKVTKICEYAFYKCKKLRKVEIPINSNLQTIESYAFCNSAIKEIFIPSKVTNICNGAFSICPNLRIIEISEELKLKTIPLSAFDQFSQTIIMIPSSLGKLIDFHD